MQDKIKQLKRQQKAEEDLKRRNLMSMYLDFYNNDQAVHTYNHIKNIYPNTINEVSSYIKQVFLTKRIVDMKAMMFQNDPEIEVDGISDDQKEKLDTIIDKTELFYKLDLTQKYCNNYLKVALFPKWDSERKETYIDIITPNNMIITQNNERPDIIDEVMINIGILEDSPTKIDTINRYHRITKEKWDIVEYNERTGNIIIIEEGENIFGEIPIAFFNLYPSTQSWWGDTKNDIVQTNLYINEYKTCLSISIHYQSFDTLVRIGDKDMLEAKPIKFGQQYSIDIAKDPMSGDTNYDAKYIHPSPDIETVAQYIKEEILNLASGHGISSRAYRADTKEASSGYSIRLDRADLIQKNIQQQKYFRKPIQDVIRFIMMTEDKNQGARFTNVIDKEITVKFGDINIDEDPKIVVDIRRDNVALGIKSPIDYILEDNPEMTEEEATEAYRENLRIKRGETPGSPQDIDDLVEDEE